MDLSSRIYVAGHRGLAGSAITRALRAAGYERLLLRTRAELDLAQRQTVERFFAAERPDYVFLAAAKVGGILANDTYPADFIRENVLIQTHVIDAAYRNGAKKLIFLGSSCIYPRMAPQPMPESCLLSGPLEQTNSAYAVAKIAGIEMCTAYRRQFGFDCLSLMPTNLYGPGDNFDLESSHVLPALIRRFHEAKQQDAAEVTVWGTGAPRREFMHADDLADAAVFLMQRSTEHHLINVGVGQDISIGELAELIRSIVGFRGRIRFDPAKPDGTPRKLLDVTRLHSMGWRARISLAEGIEATYHSFLDGGDDDSPPDGASEVRLISDRAE
jgi:GDP-L-fucose synthase